jgi:hypothetical protein
MQQHRPKLGLPVMPTDDFYQASFELFQKNQVQAIEWSFIDQLISAFDAMTLKQ